MSISARNFAATLVTGLALAGCGGNGTEGDGASPGAEKNEEFTIELDEQNGSGQTGTATFTAAGLDETRVVVELSDPPAESQPVHIHRGSCAELDPAPLHGLPNLMDGRIEATVPASVEELTAGGLALNAHRSDEQLDLYVACGDLPGSGTTGTETDEDDGY